MKNKIKNLFGIGALALAMNVNAQSVFTGLRGPTEFQLDDRVSYASKEAQNGKVTETSVNNLILKYWNGANNGVFAFANIPYKNIQSGDLESEGLGDVYWGMGPRLERKVGEGKLGILSYVGPSLATGDEKSKPALGSGRNDWKAGFFGTLLSGSKKYEADFGLDYNLTQGSDVSDELSGGVVLGGRLTDNLRLVAGPVFNFKTNGDNDGDYTLSGRVNARLTPSGKLGKLMHFEAWYDRFLDGEGVSTPKENNVVTLVARFNLGK